MPRSIILTVAFTSASIAGAQPSEEAPPEAPGDDVRAVELLEHGTQLYSEEADFAAALLAFQASFDLVPSWRALNGMGLSQKLLGDYVDAYRTFKKLLTDFGPTLSELQRSGAEGLLAELETKIGRVRIELGGGTPETAHVTLDGAKIAASELLGPHLVEPGNHGVVVTSDGFQPFADSVAVAAGETVTIEINLLREREKIIVQVEETPLVRRMPIWVPWVTVAGGAALAGAGVLFAVGAKSDFEEFDAAVAAAAGDIPRSTAVDDGAKKRGDTKVGIATGLFITGGVAAAVGVALAIVNQPRRGKPNLDLGESSATTLIVSPAGVGVSIRF